MLPKKNRIPRKDFPAHKVQGIPNQQVRGLAVGNKFFTAVFYKATNSLRPRRESADSGSRASIVVSKKTAKTAVVRNKLRRRFYELLAPYFKILPAPTTVVIYPKAEAIKASFPVLKDEVEKALKQAKVI